MDEISTSVEKLIVLHDWSIYAYIAALAFWIELFFVSLTVSAITLIALKDSSFELLALDITLLMLVWGFIEVVRRKMKGFSLRAKVD